MSREPHYWRSRLAIGVVAIVMIGLTIVGLIGAAL